MTDTPNSGAEAPAPVWFGANAPSLVHHATPPQRADVVVAGAGLAGLCVAALCAEQGASVVVVESTAVGARTTGHSTAKVTALHGLTYSALTAGRGADAAAQYAAANLEALARLRALVVDMDISCDWTDAAAVTCAATADGVGAVEDEARAAQAAGLPVQLVDGSALAVPVRAAIRLDDQAHVDPLALCRGLADTLTARGVTIVEGTPVTAVDETGTGCTVVAGGQQIHCDAAVVTTHLPIVDPAFLAGRIRPERSYVVAGPSSRLGLDAMYWAHDDGWSLRPWASADGLLVLVGGESHTMTDHVSTAQHYAALTHTATARFGVDVQHRWSAFDYRTTDGAPFIGRLSPRSRRRYVATGFHKWGMTTSMVAAMIISAQIAGTHSPYLGVFDSTRIAPTLSTQLVSNAAKVAGRFVGDRIAARRTDALPEPGGGVVVRRRGKDVAVSRDRSGRLHAVRATCTHLGCLVQFNDGDQSWDCPCHGSRFDLDGAVLDGPAVTPLEAVDLDDDTGAGHGSVS